MLKMEDQVQLTLNRIDLRRTYGMEMRVIMVCRNQVEKVNV